MQQQTDCGQVYCKHCRISFFKKKPIVIRCDVAPKAQVDPFALHYITSDPVVSLVNLTRDCLTSLQRLATD